MTRPFKTMAVFSIATAFLFFASGQRPAGATEPFSWRRVPQSAFQAGEHLVFDVGWQAAVAGTIVLDIGRPVSRQGRTAYPVTCRAASNVITDQVFRVRDRITSWTDTQALASLGYSEQIEEGDHRRNKTVFIHPEKKSAYPPYVQDVLSALLYVRAQPLKVPSSIPVSILNQGAVTGVVVRVVSKETVDSAFGQMPCVKAELRQDDNRIFIWFSDDKRHLPIRIAGELPFGSVSADLVSR